MKIVACTSLNKRFWWESFVFLNNLRENNYSNNSLLLVYVDPKDIVAQKSKHLWDKLREEFKEVEFFFWEDNEDFINLMRIFSYIPLMRPKLLLEYWKLHPEMESEIFFYVDTDILITKPIDWSEYINDDIIYMSDAKSYTNLSYFDSKKRLKENTPEFVLESKYNNFLKRDFVEEFTATCGINREILEKYNENSGAAQYVLKTIPTSFWEEFINSCCTLKLSINKANQEFFKGNTPNERENNGWQAWCTDIWVMNWLLLRYKRDIKTLPSLNFTWATSKIEDIENNSIYHNAGITSDEKIKVFREKTEVECPAFYKGNINYVNDVITPFEDIEKLNKILNNPISNEFAMIHYCKQLIKTKYKYNL